MLPRQISLSVLLSLAPTASGQILHFEAHGLNNDRLGFSVANLGDLNGDGVDDLAAGAPQRWHAGFTPGPGYVRVYSGADGAILLEVFGDQVGDQFGYSVDGVGDFDGDGVRDLVVGAPQEGTQPASGGYARVVSGADGSTLRNLASSTPGDRAGTVVRGLGDVNMDGTPDLLISAPYNSFNGLIQRGLVSVISGATGGTLALHRGAQYHRLGLTTFVGKFDHDGVRDYGILTTPPSSAPFVRLWSGATSTLLSTLPIRARAVVGDMNGDGLDDLTHTHEVYSGADGSLLIDFPKPTSSFPYMPANRPGGIGDYDGDGTLDLLSGCLYHYQSTAMFSGSSGTLGQQIGYPASAICDLGDLDQDGFSDFALGYTGTVGSSLPDPAGTVRVFRGTPAAPAFNYCYRPYSFRILGTSSLTNNDLSLEARSLPISAQTGIVIMGDSTQSVPFGNGQLCVAGNIVRVTSPISILATTIVLSLDLDQPPFGSALQPGDTRTFQFWYRTTASFDLTGAIQVTFGL